MRLMSQLDQNVTGVELFEHGAIVYCETYSGTKIITAIDLLTRKSTCSREKRHSGACKQAAEKRE
jgi:hypothetical protein